MNSVVVLLMRADAHPPPRIPAPSSSTLNVARPTWREAVGDEDFTIEFLNRMSDLEGVLTARKSTQIFAFSTNAGCSGYLVCSPDSAQQAQFYILSTTRST